MMAASLKTSLAWAILISVLAAGKMSAATLYVDPNDPTAFESVQEAIDAAWDFDVIMVYPGVYREHVNYHGGMVTVTGIDPNNPVVIENTIIEGDGTGTVVVFRNSEGLHSVLQGITIRNGQNGIECLGAGTSPLITKCRIVSNAVAGIACSLASPTVTETTIESNVRIGMSASLGETSLCRICSNGSGKDGDAGLADCRGLVRRCVISSNIGDGVRNQVGDVENCLISANLKNGVCFRGLSCSGGCNIINCTVVGNKANGVSVDHPSASVDVAMKNTIVVLNGNFAVYGISNSWGGGYGNVSVDWTDIFGNSDGSYSATTQVALAIGQHNISQDPLFAKRGYWDESMVWHEGDYHLKSQLGRWDTRSTTWVIDPAGSPCLDRGDPASPFLEEPYPNGGRVNLGAYGGTAEASMSPGGARCLEYPEMDFNHDCRVDQADLDLFMQHWLECNLDPNDACWPEGKP